MKEPLPTTACIRNSGFSAKSEVSAFNKSMCQIEIEELLKPLLLIHANRWAQCEQKLENLMKIVRTEL